MNTMTKILGAAAFGAAALGAAGSASAATVDGITFTSGAVFAIGSVFEDYVTSPGDVLEGIGQVTNIYESDGTTSTWSTGQNGRELTYVFGGFVLEAIVPTTGGFQLFFSGGTASFYSDTAMDFTASSGSKATNLASATNGTEWLTVDAAASFGTCGGEGLTCLNGDDTGITLVSTIQGSLEGINSGSGFSLFDVVGGAAGELFNTDAFAGTDISATFSFADSQGNVDYDLSGSMDARLVNAIPEPATLGLFGIGLVGLGALARRRKA